jgi:hypothetical protein
VWVENEVRGDSVRGQLAVYSSANFLKRAKNQENNAKRLCSLAHNAKNVERTNRLAHNKRCLRTILNLERKGSLLHSIDFKPMLQVLDHDPYTRIQQKANVSTVSREVF